MNWPSGQTCLQKAAPWKMVSTAKRGGEVGERDPGRPPGRRPQVEELVGEEEEHDQRDGDPLVAQQARAPGGRPPSQMLAHPAAGPPRQHERAGHAEEIAGQQQREDDEAAVVEPDADGRQVLRRELRSDQAVEDHQPASRSSGICMASRACRHLQEPADDRPGREHRRGRRRSSCGATCYFTSTGKRRRMTWPVAQRDLDIHVPGAAHGPLQRHAVDAVLRPRRRPRSRASCRRGSCWPRWRGGRRRPAGPPCPSG